MLVTKSAVVLRCQRMRTNLGLVAGEPILDWLPGNQSEIGCRRPEMRMHASATNFELSLT